MISWNLCLLFLILISVHPYSFADVVVPAERSTNCQLCATGKDPNCATAWRGGSGQLCGMIDAGGFCCGPPSASTCIPDSTGPRLYYDCDFHSYSPSASASSPDQGPNCVSCLETGNCFNAYFGSPGQWCGSISFGSDQTQYCCGIDQSCQAQADNLGNINTFYCISPPTPPSDSSASSLSIGIVIVIVAVIIALVIASILLVCRSRSLNQQRLSVNRFVSQPVPPTSHIITAPNYSLYPSIPSAQPSTIKYSPLPGSLSASNPWARSLDKQQYAQPLLHSPSVPTAPPPYYFASNQK